ncbi:MAG: hypothetical protein LUD50_06310 [Clostridia bacterium]|nr:hypothetical protein [Clostridia bacterium]
MKKFKYKFNTVTYVLIGLCLALAVAALILNTYYIITEGIRSAQVIVYPILQYTLTYFVALAVLLLLISLLISSYYSVTSELFTTSFGIIKSKYKVQDIDMIVLDKTNPKKKDRLSVYFNNETFITIVVKPEWFDAFTDALKEANPSIRYDIENPEDLPSDDDNGQNGSKKG